MFRQVGTRGSLAALLNRLPKCVESRAGSNPAARHGNPVGGDFAAGQWLGERLSYRSGIPRLYLSNSVWPTSLSWMAPGYNAASVVAEDLGLRDQPWWINPPLPDLP